MSCFHMLFRHRRLIWNLTLLDFRLRYAGSRLGLVWMLLAPLLMLGAYLLLFGGILQVRPDQSSTGVEYGLLIACGLLPWIGFSEGVTRGTASVLAQRNLIKSHVFPMELFPVSAVCAGLIGQLCGTLLLLVLLGLRGMLGPNLAVLPFLLILQALFTVGLVWFLSCVNIIYRDTSQVVVLMMVLLMFISPIAYTQEMAPAGLKLVVELNPISYLIEGYRNALLYNQFPNVRGLVIFGGLALLVLLAGYRYFMHLRRVLPDYV
ncbi:MAG: ABC transporter [Nitrospirae bacterium]|nr:MAG: ABC transporter [Nitrospirota bacterium]